MKYLDGRYASLYGHYFYVHSLDIETFDSIRHFFEIKEVSDDFVARNRAKLIEASEGYRISFAINGYIAVLSQNNVADAIWKQDSACKCLCESGIRTLKCKNCPQITDRFAFFDECDDEDRILGYRIIREYHDGYIKMSFLVEKFILDVFLRNSRYVYVYKIVHKTYERWCVIEKYDAEHDDYYEIVVDEWGNDYPTRTPEEFDEIYAFCDRICHGGHSYLCKEETMEDGMKKYHVMCRHGLKYTNVCVTTNYEEVREYFERCWKEI